MKNRSRIALAVTTVAAFAGSGSAALAEPPEPIGPGDVIVELPTVPLPGPGLDLPETDDPCDPIEEECGDPGPVDPGPGPGDPGPGFPGPGDLTADPCDPIEESCSPDPCDPVEESCEPGPGETPEPGECDLDEICLRTPTFTG